MKRWINEWIYKICVIYWMCRTMLPHVLGRWFVFRKAPTWFVKDMSMIGEEGDDDVIKNYVVGAQEELKLRERFVKEKS